MKYMFVFLLQIYCNLLKKKEKKKCVVCTSLKNTTELLNPCIIHLAGILQFQPVEFKEFSLELGLMLCMHLSVFVIHTFS